MEYYTIQEVAALWDLTPRRVQSLCQTGAIPGAIKFGKNWAVPRTAERPADHRLLQFRTYRSESGFSLVELIVVIAIMAVLAGVLTPSLLRYIEKSREGVDSVNIRNLYTELNAERLVTGGTQDIESAKVLLRQMQTDWQYSDFAETLYALFDEHDEKPVKGGVAWVEYTADTGLSRLHFGDESEAEVIWPSLKNAGAMARAFSLSGKTTIYGGDMEGLSEDEKKLIQELKKKMNWGDGITLHVGNINTAAGTIQISCVNENLNSSAFEASSSWGKQTTATRITFNYNTGEIVKVVEQGGKWGNNNGTQGFWSNQQAKVIYEK